MSTVHPSLSLLEQAQEDISLITITETHPSSIDVVADVENYDGTFTHFAVQVDISSGRLVARKEPNENQLPDTCYDRHIMSDGSFCIGLEGDEGFTNRPQSFEEYKGWWLTLLGFLKLQHQSNLTKRWKKNFAWKHSHDMAKFQQKLADHKASLPDDLKRMLDENQFALMPCHKHSRHREDRMQHRRRACPCGSTKQLMHCHEKVLVAIIQGTQQLEQSQKQWLELRVQAGVRCCGTLKHCELKNVYSEMKRNNLI